MELVIHRDKLESSTERERKRKDKKGKEWKGEKAKPRGKMWCGNVKIKNKKRPN